MRLIILGAGGFGKTIADIAGQLDRYESIDFLDDNAKGDHVIGRLEDFEQLISDDKEFYPAFGDNHLRYDWLIRLSDAKAAVATIIHKMAYVSETATIGKGSVVLPNAVIGTNCIVCNGVIINYGAIIDHDVLLGNGVHIAPGVVIKGDNLIAAFSKIDSGSVINNRVYPFEEYPDDIADGLDIGKADIE